MRKIFLLVGLALSLMSCKEPDPPKSFQIGLNKFDLATGYLGTASGGDRTDRSRRTTIAMARKALWDAHNVGATFLRTAITGYGPNLYPDRSEFALWVDDPTTYWKLMDLMISDVEAYDMKIVPSIVWHDVQFPALVGGETIGDLYRNPESKSYKLLAKFVSEFITRYKNRNAILFYEIGNEQNLGSDIDLVDYIRRTGGDITHYSNYTTDDLIGFTTRLSSLIRTLDNTRSISSGFAMPRENAYRNWKKMGGLDSAKEMTSYLLATHAGMDIVSVHPYKSDSANDFSRFGMTTRGVLKTLMDGVSSASKKLYLGEFGLGTGNLTDKTAFYSDVYSAIIELGVHYSSPWIFEFYQFSTTDFDWTFHIEPGYTDRILEIIRKAAQAGGRTVTPQGPPNIVLTSPWTGEIIGTQAKLYSVASASKGSIAKVEYYLGDKLLGTVTTQPYQMIGDFSTFANGTYALKAKAFDSDGLSSESIVSVVVSRP